MNAVNGFRLRIIIQQFRPEVVSNGQVIVVMITAQLRRRKFFSFFAAARTETSMS